MTSRITIVSGHYGVGKSEFAVNLAIRLARGGGGPVALVDLDIVNPYFRSREARGSLEAAGVTVIGNSLEIDRGVDFPAIPAAVAMPFADSALRAVIDLGGDPAGARALAQFRSRIPTEDTDFLYVVNRYRPETSDAPSIRRSIRAIEAVMKMKIAGLVNNSHLLDETRVDHLLAGQKICRELVATDQTLRIAFVSGVAPIMGRLSDYELDGERVPLKLYLRSEWMTGGNVHFPGRTKCRKES